MGGHRAELGLTVDAAGGQTWNGRWRESLGNRPKIDPKLTQIGPRRLPRSLSGAMLGPERAETPKKAAKVSKLEPLNMILGPHFFSRFRAFFRFWGSGRVSGVAPKSSLLAARLRLAFVAVFGRSGRALWRPGARQRRPAPPPDPHETLRIATNLTFGPIWPTLRRKAEISFFFRSFFGPKVRFGPPGGAGAIPGGGPKSTFWPDQV